MSMVTARVEPTELNASSGDRLAGQSHRQADPGAQADTGPETTPPIAPPEYTFGRSQARLTVRRLSVYR